MHRHFEPSELILNKDGTVYHLHLHPEQIADTIITVGDPDRVKMVSKYFDSIEFINQSREFITHTGNIGNKRLTVISTGIGTDNIDIVLNELHLLKNFDLKQKTAKPQLTKLEIIRIGTSGCIQKDIPVDSLLVSEFAIGIDNVMQFYKFENTTEEEQLLEQFKSNCYFFHTIHPYIFKAAESLYTIFSKEFISGITLTAPGFYAPQGRKINLPVTQEKFYDDIVNFKYQHYRVTNFEMETSALYGLSKLLGHGCISLNALLANRATGEFSKDSEKTVDKLIAKTLELIC
ncbi:MAG: nucleoside phosphorylase [Chitinophagales bacterium]